MALSGFGLATSPVVQSRRQETQPDLFFCNSVIAVRPTGHRLLIAMAVASILLAVLLELQAGLKIDVANYFSTQDVPLTVYITRRNSAASKTKNRAFDESVEQEQLLEEAAPAEFANAEQGETIDSADPPVDSEPVRDWYGLMQQSAQASVDEYFARQGARESTWQQTRSVMFKPGNDFNVKKEEPILTKIKFRQPVGVLGLGLTIGSCFIGIPIAGVPVEERSTAITLFVCREDSG